ncbi:uncharacterized protein LOC121386839 isoform X2 [Gigantopelta aegis]|uniref:uncharacterized protein LOC121386839 isoform X2 n=1 Tax=Gigantopelta aegis TaxID=1735272 RepID=UPI001B88D362|nr:uncharacterized protein LOC121386839 isoform X2 [Gigantopelta aegis]
MAQWKTRFLQPVIFVFIIGIFGSATARLPTDPLSSGCLQKLNTCSPGDVLNETCSYLEGALTCLRTDDAQCQDPDKTTMITTSEILLQLSTRCNFTAPLSDGCTKRRTTCMTNVNLDPPTGDKSAYCRTLGGAVSCLRADDAECQDPDKTIMISTPGILKRISDNCRDPRAFPVPAGCMDRMNTCLNGGTLQARNCSTNKAILACLLTDDATCQESDKSLMIFMLGLARTVFSCHISELTDGCDINGLNVCRYNGTCEQRNALELTCKDSKLEQCGKPQGPYSLSNLAKGVSNLCGTESRFSQLQVYLSICPTYAACQIKFFASNVTNLSYAETVCGNHFTITNCLLKNIKPCQAIATQSEQTSLTDTRDEFAKFCPDGKFCPYGMFCPDDKFSSWYVCPYGKLYPDGMFCPVVSSAQMISCSAQMVISSAHMVCSAHMVRTVHMVRSDQMVSLPDDKA